MKKPTPKRAGIAVSIRPMDQYEVEDAARTIARAEQHKRNPEMMKKVKAHVATLSAAVGGDKPKRGGGKNEMPRR